jgi:hypothetical protein
MLCISLSAKMVIHFLRCVCRMRRFQRPTHVSHLGCTTRGTYASICTQAVLLCAVVKLIIYKDVAVASHV